MKGRPRKYDPIYHPKIVKYMARCGMTDEEIAKDLGIAKSTLNKWKLDFPDFSDSLKENKYFIDSLVENSLLKRALGYDYSEIHEEDGFVKIPGEGEKKVKALKRKVIKKKVLPDTTAMIFWLKNRQSAIWRDKVDHEHTGRGGGPIEISQKETREMAEELDNMDI